MENPNVMGLIGNMFWFTGVVECIDDPEKQGRVRVRVLGEHTQDKAEIPTDHLPWSLVMLPTTSASISGVGESPLGLMHGSWVIGFYLDGENKQQPVIIGSIGGHPLDPPFGMVGFNDYNECFPQVDKLDEPDTNRLARGTVGKHCVDHTAVTVRRNSVMNNIATAADTWSEPATPYAAIYPYNYVWEGPYNPDCDGCEWGHLEEWDSTPGSERYFRQHKTSQNFLEIHPDGKEVRKIFGDGFEIDLASKHLYVEGDYRVTVMGNKDEYIKGDYWQHVEGDFIRVVEGDKVCHTLGKDALTVQSDMIRRAVGNIYTASELNLIFHCNIDTNIVSGVRTNLSSTVETAIATGSFSSVSIDSPPTSSVSSDSYPSVALSCSEENMTKSAVSNKIIPDIPAFTMTTTSAFNTQVQVMPGVIWLDSKFIHELGETFFKETAHFNKKVHILEDLYCMDDVFVDIDVNIMGDFFLAGDSNVGGDSYVGGDDNVGGSVLAGSDVNVGGSLFATSPVAFDPLGSHDYLVPTGGAAPEAPNEPDAPIAPSPPVIPYKPVIIGIANMPSKSYSRNDKVPTPVIPDTFIECE